MSERIIFANNLRGLAAILVVVSHFVGIFFVMNPVICSLLGVPVLESLPPLPDFLRFTSENSIVLGQFGVGIFFIISGFVIPFSLINGSRRSFLFRRAMRIYPVYIVGFSFSMLVLYILAVQQDTVYKFPFFDIFAHFGIITRALLDVSRIDGISWTLEVEIYFYLLLCIFSTRILNFNFKRYLFSVVLVAVIAAFTFKFKWYLVGVQVASGLMLLLGMAFHSFINKKINLVQLLFLEGLVLGLIPVLWIGFASPADYIYPWMSGYLLAIVAFHGCYFLREKFSSNKIVEHFADISYPLYVVHALTGYSVMYMLIVFGTSSVAAISAAALVSYAAAVIIHLMIEKPFILLSKKKICISTIVCKN